MKQIRSTKTARQKLELLDLPTELLLIIFTYVLKHDAPIIPEERPVNSGKFHHVPRPTYIYLDEPDSSFVNAHVGTTCKRINSIVMGENMIFYKNNTFQFLGVYGAQTMVDYLVSLTSDRRNAIRSIKVGWNALDSNSYSYLSVCQNLQHLSLEISDCYQDFGPTSFSPVFKKTYEQTMKLRGISSVNLVWPWIYMGEPDLTRDFPERGHLRTVEMEMKKVLCSGSKEDSLVTKEEILAAVEFSFNDRDHRAQLAKTFERVLRTL